MKTRSRWFGSLIPFVALPLVLGCQEDVVGPVGPNPPPVEKPLEGPGLVILPGDAALEVGGVLELQIAWWDGGDMYDNPPGDCFWTSDDTSVATVSQNGLVQGMTAGTVIIRVEIDGEEAEARVTVTQ